MAWRGLVGMGCAPLRGPLSRPVYSWVSASIGLHVLHVLCIRLLFSSWGISDIERGVVEVGASVTLPGILENLKFGKHVHHLGY